MYILPQNCMNIEDWVGNQQILSTVSSRGDADMQRLISLPICGILIRFKRTRTAGQNLPELMEKLKFWFDLL